LPDLISGLISFTAYFAGAIAFCAGFCLVYTWLTPHREFDLIVRQHNASAAVAFGGSLIGFAIALAGAIHNTQSAPEFVAWGFVAFATQVVAYFLARLAHPGLSHAIEQNALAAALWVAAVSISAGVISAACMSP
jgi:putative membrane protein